MKENQVFDPKTLKLDPKVYKDGNSKYSKDKVRTTLQTTNNKKYFTKWILKIP